MSKLLVAGKEVQLKIGESGVPAMTFARSTYQDLGFIQGDMSVETMLPPTLINQEVFGVHDPTFQGPREAWTTIADMELIGDDGLVITSGTIKLEELSSEGYSIRLFGGVSDWIRRLRGKKIGELNLGTEVYTKAEILDSWTSTTKNVVYPLIDYGTIGSQLSTTSIDVDYLKPAVFYLPILVKMFGNIGFAVNFHGRVGQYINKLHFPFTTEVIPVSQDVLDGETVRVEKLGTQTITTFGPGTKVTYAIELQDDNNRWSVDTYTADKDGQYLIASENLTITFAKDPAFGAGFSAFITYIVQIGPLTFSGVVTSSSTTPQAFNLTDKSGVFPLDGTETVYVYFTEVRVSSAGIKINSAKLSVTPVSIPFQLGLSYDVAGVLPEMDQDVFLKGLVNTFNWIIETDTQTGTVDVYTEQDYLLDQTQAVNWEEKTDQSRPPKMIRLRELKKNLKFSHAEDDKDFYINSWEVTRALGSYANRTFVLSNEYLAGTQSMVETPFAPTRMGNVFTDVPLFAPQLAHIDTGSSTDTYEFEPRILIYEGLRDGRWKYDGFTQESYPYSYFIHDESDIFTVNLCFNNQTLHGPNVVGLVDQYYADKLNRLNLSALISAYQELTDIDINELDFRRPHTIKMDTGNYVTGYLNKVVEYKSGQVVTRVELIQIQ